MAIYRGAGGAGDAVGDSASEVLLALQAKDAAVAAQVAAEAAQAAAETAQAAAELAETNAETAETNAETAETNAETAETNAETAATNAASSASAASTSASNASTSETNASNSASAAATSASNAASSASSASSSASTATTQATNASNSATAAANSATAAANSATAAQTAQTAAELAETNAETAETNAETAETNAAASASAASTSATNASNSASSASTSATNAANSASAASTSATNASNSASAASTSASNAATSATAAQNAQTAAETARDQTLTAYDNFDDRYLGAKASNPTLDNDGNALVAGALYFNSTDGAMRVYTGSVWVDAYAAGTSFLAKANNLSDLPDKAVARDNLGVEIGVDVQAYDAQLADIAGLTPSDNNFIVGNGTNFVTESGSTARTSLGLGTIATQDSNNVAITGGSINGTTVGASTPSTGSFTSLTDSGNLAFTGTGNRITGDMSNATVANRVAFQNSVTNNATSITVVPNGTSNTSNLNLENSSTPLNNSLMQVSVDSTLAYVISGIRGTGTYLPLVMYTGGSERLRITTAGDLYIGDDKRYGFGGTNNAIAGNTAGNILYFVTNSSERMRIDSSGNVGIGTSSPSYGLHVSKAQGSAGIQSTTTTNSTYLAFINGGGTSYVGVDNSTGGAFSSGAYGMTLFNAANSPTTFMTNATERMRIASNGDVSIGSTASNAKLFVDATNKIAVYGAVNGANVAGYFTTAGANYAVYGQSSGNYGIYGRTTDTSYGGVIGVSADGTTYGILAYANAYSLYTNASIYVNGTVYGSDERLKENIKPINNALSKINQLNPVSFDWKANSSKGITNNNQPLPDYGMIAQEVEQVLPDIVYEIPVPPKPIENNKPDSIEQELGLTKGVDYSRLIPFLTKAIQELTTELDVVKAELNTLKNPPTDNN